MPHEAKACKKARAVATLYIYCLLGPPFEYVTGANDLLNSLLIILLCNLYSFLFLEKNLR